MTNKDVSATSVDYDPPLSYPCPMVTDAPPLREMFYVIVTINCAISHFSFIINFPPLVHVFV